jgi:thermitase
MRKIVTLLLTASAVLAVLAGPVAVADEDDEPDEDTYGAHTDGYGREVVVKLAPAFADAIDRINAEYGTHTLRRPLGDAAVYRLGLPDGRSAAELADELDEDHRLLYAEVNVVQEVLEQTRRFAWHDGLPTPAAAAGYRTQYAVEQLGLPRAHGYGRGAGTVVAVLDSGLYAEHPVFAGRIAPGGYDFVDDDHDPREVRDGVDDDGDGQTDEADGHGTHVAGLALLVAPDTRVLPLRVLDSEGNGDAFTIAEAVLRAVAHGADVITMSFGTTARSEVLDDVLEDAEEAGVVSVGAAGNHGSDSPQYPAASATLAVTATTAAGPLAPFAGFGPWVTVAAPGDDLVSAFGPSGYAEWDGTSMAAPLVAGAAALLRGVRPLSAEDIADLLADTARPTCAGCGHGRVDPAAALQAHPDD